jgi:hypothetical protein
MKWFPPWGWSRTTRDDVLTGVSRYDATMNKILQTYNELWDNVGGTVTRCGGRRSRVEKKPDGIPKRSLCGRL